MAIRQRAYWPAHARKEAEGNTLPEVKLSAVLGLVCRVEDDLECLDRRFPKHPGNLASGFKQVTLYKQDV